MDDGTNYVRIPNRHVWVLGNVIDNPRRQGDQLFSIAGPFSGPEQDGSGLGDVRADDDLHIAVEPDRGPRAAARRGRLHGRRLRRDRRAQHLDAAPGLFRAPAQGDLRLAAGQTAPDPALPSFGWDDSGGVRP